MNDGGDCKTAPATPGLLKTQMSCQFKERVNQLTMNIHPNISLFLQRNVWMNNQGRLIDCFFVLTTNSLLSTNALQNTLKNSLIKLKWGDNYKVLRKTHSSVTCLLLATYTVRIIFELRHWKKYTLCFIYYTLWFYQCQIRTEHGTPPRTVKSPIPTDVQRTARLVKCLEKINAKLRFILLFKCWVPLRQIFNI